MTDSEKELVRRLREHKEPNATWHVDRDCTEAADAIERLARERDEARAEANTLSKSLLAHQDKLNATEAEVKMLRTRVGSIDTEVYKHISESERVRKAEAEVARLRNIILWADGQIGEWPERKEREGAFYWRKELMRRLEAKHD